MKYRSLFSFCDINHSVRESSLFSFSNGSFLALRQKRLHGIHRVQENVYTLTVGASIKEIISREEMAIASLHQRPAPVFAEQTWD